jgi:hypothetical protein
VVSCWRSGAACGRVEVLLSHPRSGVARGREHQRAIGTGKGDARLGTSRPWGATRRTRTRMRAALQPEREEDGRPSLQSWMLILMLQRHPVRGCGAAGSRSGRNCGCGSRCTNTAARDSPAGCVRGRSSRSEGWSAMPLTLSSPL